MSTQPGCSQLRADRYPIGALCPLITTSFNGTWLLCRGEVGQGRSSLRSSTVPLSLAIRTSARLALSFAPCSLGSWRSEDGTSASQTLEEQPSRSDRGLIDRLFWTCDPVATSGRMTLSGTPRSWLRPSSTG